jgi:molybdate transport system substrate-binding protein
LGNFLKTVALSGFLPTKNILKKFFGVIFLIFGAHLGAAQPVVRMAVAASLTEPAQELARHYLAQYRVKVELVPAASGTLAAQVRSGAPFDIFFSADRAYPDALVAEGLAAGPAKVLLRGQVVLWASPALAGNSPAEVLAARGLRRLALPQPGLAPHGTLARDWLTQQKLLPNLEAKLVYGENVGKVNQYIATGAVQAAFTAASAQHLPALRGKGRWLVVGIPPIPHAALVVRGRDRPEVLAFFAWLASPVAAKVFVKYGYLAGEK